MEQSLRKLMYARDRYIIYQGLLYNLSNGITFNESDSLEKYYVEPSMIQKHDKELIENYSYQIRNSLFKPYHNHFLRSIFIENCYYEPSTKSIEELKLHLFNNYVTYSWWDTMTFEELVKALSRFSFTKSTEAVIEYDKMYDYLKLTYHDKERLLHQIFLNFDFPDGFIHSDYNQLDYQWCIGKYIIKAIRIIENEIRSALSTDNVGALYNESVLFREISRNFGNTFKVISQGSPSWLGSQRFDIYLPDLNIAIEYQGEQHYRPVDFGGKGLKVAKKLFQENQKRDLIKLEKANQNNCKIIYVLPRYNLDTVIEQVKDAIDEILNR